MEFARDVDLRPFNTLAVPARAAYFCRIASAGDIADAIAFSNARQLPCLILGGGSNIVLSRDFPGLVMHIAIEGVEARTVGERVELRAGAGENWDALVRHCLQRGWYGLENLIAIPGNVGAAPIQNIGAYGVELGSVLHSVEGWHIHRGKHETLNRDECELAYRDSIFKHRLRDQFIITHVNLHLSAVPAVNTEYQVLRAALADEPAVTPEKVAAAVAAIRASKLPDPAEKPNVGSFFKNPVVSAADCRALRERYPELPVWPAGEGRCKLAAGWLVDRLGWKGRREADVGVHEQQALVLVNYGHAGGERLLALAERIRRDVLSTFGVNLEIEPRIY